MDENRQRILDAAEMQFMRLGIRSVSMDDVAREISISKKTLYQYFDNKDHLVSEVMKNHLQKEMEDYDRIHEESENSIEEIHQISKCMRKHLSSVNPATLHDVKKYHGNAWAHFEEFKSGYIKERLVENLTQGKKEGYYREEMNPDIISIMRLEQVQLMFDPGIFPPEVYDAREVQIQLLDHFVHGLLTEKGRELYQKFQIEEAKTHNS
jgi:AcrR family transcriptional regulator